MKNLPDIGNDFLRHFQQGVPEFAEKFNPGISRPEIQLALGASPTSLPEDFYALYEWRNGYADFNGHPKFNLQSFAPFHFNTMEMLVVEKEWEWCDDDPPKYKGCEILPLVSCGRVFWGIVLDRNYQNEAHIVYVDTVGECILRYDSITSMLNSLVESFEVGALYFNQAGSIERNDKLFSDILIANNPKTLREGVADFEGGIEDYGFNIDSNRSDYEERMETLLNGLSTLYYMRPRTVVERVTRKLLALEGLSSPKARSAYGGLQRWLRSASE